MEEEDLKKSQSGTAKGSGGASALKERPLERASGKGDGYGEMVTTQVKPRAPSKMPLEQRLMQEERERQVRLLELQAEGERNEMATLSQKPKITKRAKELHRQGDVADRLFEYGKQREKRREAMAAHAHAEEWSPNPQSRP